MGSPRFLLHRLVEVRASGWKMVGVRLPEAEDSLAAKGLKFKSLLNCFFCSLSTCGLYAPVLVMVSTKSLKSNPEDAAWVRHYLSAWQPSRRDI